MVTAEMTASAEVRKELDKIKRRNRGVLRAADVVEFARDPDTALHSHFTWDDSAAAEAYRLWQARKVIAVHVQVVKQDTQPVRAYVSLMSDRVQEGGGYRAIVDVLKDADRRAELLAQALAEAKAWQAKYAALSELAPIFEAIDRAASAAGH